MKVSSERRPPREAVLTVDLDERDVEPYLDRAYRQAVRRLNVPGFRKGKAPRRIIEQLFGREYLLNEALDSMIQESTSKAVEEEDLDLGGIPQVSIEQLDPPIFKATVPLAPEVDLGDFESVRVEKAAVEVSEERIDETLEQLRRDFGVWEPTDGPVEMDDLIELTIEGWIEEADGERREIIHSENTEYIPRPGTRFPVPDFDSGLVGLPQNELTSFTLDVPEDFENEEYAGKKAYFEATVHQVKRKTVPELDDEFAKGVGEGFETVGDLRERVKSDLVAQEERRVNAEHQEQTFAKVVEAATVEMSPIIVDHEMEHYIEERQENLRQGRVTIEQYQQYLLWQSMTPEEIQNDARPQVEERLKRAHVLREVARRKGIEVADAEVDEEIEAILGDAGDRDDVRKLFDEEERRQSIRRMLQNRRALDYLTQAALGETPSDQETAEEAVAEEAVAEEAVAEEAVVEESEAAADGPSDSGDGAEAEPEKS